MYTLKLLKFVYSALNLGGVSNYDVSLLKRNGCSMADP